MFQSIAGAPISVRVTRFGLVIESDDIAARLKLEDLIYDALGDSASLGARPAAFRVYFRSASEIKGLLEELMGIASAGGGGGGGGLGGLFGGAVSNAVGGAAGDLVGGLIGGGGAGAASGGGAIYLPEGEVVMVPDEKTNTLYVSASVNDMDVVRMLIEELDRADAPHDPNILGENHLIYLEFRDPNEIAEIIRANFSDVLNESNSGGNGNNQQQVQQQLQQQLMNAITGRGGRGGNNRDPEEAKPKASMTVDEKQGALVVTGPRNIYLQIRSLAMQLDRPGAEANDRYEFVRPSVAPGVLQESLRSAFGDKIVIVGSESGGTTPATGGGAGGGGAGGGNRQPGGTVVPFNTDAIRALQQLRGGGGGGGNRGGGAGNRGGGGGNRGGGGGNRGGGRG